VFFFFAAPFLKSFFYATDSTPLLRTRLDDSVTSKLPPQFLFSALWPLCFIPLFVVLSIAFEGPVRVFVFTVFPFFFLFLAMPSSAGGVYVATLAFLFGLLRLESILSAGSDFSSLRGEGCVAESGPLSSLLFVFFPPPPGRSYPFPPFT